MMTILKIIAQLLLLWVVLAIIIGFGVIVVAYCFDGKNQRRGRW